MKYRMLAAAALSLFLMTGCSLLDELPDLSENSVVDPVETEPAQPTEEEIREALSERQEQGNAAEDFPIPDMPEPFEYQGELPDEPDLEDIEPEDTEPEHTEPAETDAESQTETSRTETAPADPDAAEEPEAVLLEEDTLICEQQSGRAVLFGLDPEPSTGGGPLQIPDTFGGKPVTAVADYAFRDTNYVNRLRLPETVTEIGSNAFCGCNLTDLKLLTGSELHAGSYVFKECAMLETVQLRGMTAEFGDGCFAESAAVSVETEDCTLRFSDRCFQEMRKLETVSFTGDTAFGDKCFRECTALKSISFTGGAVDTGTNLCYESALHDVTFTDCTGKVGDLSFANCESLRTLTVSEGITTFGYGVCRNCSTLRNIYLPASLTSIGEDCFSGCPGITVIAPEGSYALQYAKNHGFRTRKAPAA